MARKYGIIAASDLKVGAVRDSNFHSASLRGARANNNPMSTVGYPRMTSPGEQWAGMGHAIGTAIFGGSGSGSGSGRADTDSTDSTDSTDNTSTTSSGTGTGGRGRQPALRTSQKIGMKIGRGMVTGGRSVVSTLSGSSSRIGGNPPGAASAAPAPAQPSPGSFYQAPVAMGANVPLSRQKKFAQGRGL